MSAGRRRGWGIVVGLVLVGAVSAGAWRLRLAAAATPAADGPVVPTARVTRGALELSVHATGELRAARSMMLPAPSVGGTLRILRLVATGTAVKKGDVVAELDPSEQQYALEQAQSQLDEAVQTVTKKRDDLLVATAEQQVALLGAQFDVRRAELDNRLDKDLISANDFAKRQLAVDQAKQQLTRLETDTAGHLETDKAALALVEEGRAKAQIAMDRARQNIDSLVLRAPMDGLVVIRENRDASGGMFFSGMTLPEYRAGDNTFAGRPLVDVFDLTGMELRVKVDEMDRANVTVGQAAEVRPSALPGVAFTAKVSAIAGLAGSSDWWDASGPSRQFDATLTLDRVDPRLRPGTTVDAVLKGQHIDGVLCVPLQAVRQRNGKPVVFVQTPHGFEPRDVKVVYRTESRAGLEGVDEGATVALVDPTTTATPTAPAGGAIK